MDTLAQWAAIAWQYRDEALELIGAVVLGATALTHALRALVAWLGKIALRTATKADDAAVKLADRVLGSTAIGLDKAYRLMRPMAIRGTGDKVKERTEPDGEWQVIKKLSTRPPPPPTPNKAKGAA